MTNSGLIGSRGGGHSVGIKALPLVRIKTLPPVRIKARSHVGLVRAKATCGSIPVGIKALPSVRIEGRPALWVQMKEKRGQTVRVQALTRIGLIGSRDGGLPVGIKALPSVRIEGRPALRVEMKEKRGQKECMNRAHWVAFRARLTLGAGISPRSPLAAALT